MQNRSHHSINLEYSHIDMNEEFPVEIWSREKYRLDDCQISKLHFHNYLEIGYCFEGGGVFLIDDKILTFSKGDASIIFAKHVHIAQSEKNTVSLWNFINLDQEKLLAGLPLQELSKTLRIGTVKSGLPYIFSNREYCRINQIVLDIITEIFEEKRDYQSAVRSLLWLLFIELGRVANVNLANRELIHQDSSMRLLPAIDYIAKHYVNQVYIKDLALLCNTSVRNFRRLFQRTFNLSPIEYITKFRIEMSGILLLNSDYSILEIAEKNGIETLSSFNRHFKKLMGVTPRDWRKNRGI